MAHLSSVAERFIHTNFLTHQKVARSPKDAGKGPLLLITMGMLIMVCFFICLWVRIYVLEIGYEMSNALKDHKRLLQENRRLIIERAVLQDSARIDEIARNKLGMVIPDNRNVVVVPWSN